MHFKVQSKMWGCFRHLQWERKRRISHESEVGAMTHFTVHSQTILSTNTRLLEVLVNATSWMIIYTQAVEKKLVFVGAPLQANRWEQEHWQAPPWHGNSPTNESRSEAEGMPGSCQSLLLSSGTGAGYRTLSAWFFKSISGSTNSSQTLWAAYNETGRQAADTNRFAVSTP